MSLFLGKIHYWLFNKILWFEKLEDEIIDLAKKEGFENPRAIRYNEEEFKWLAGRMAMW